MFQQAKVTLYDFFGYLLPGLAVLGAVGLLFWAIHYPTELVALDVPGAEAWVIVLTVGYIAGHIAQAFSNLLLKLLEAPFRWLRSWKRLEKWQWFQKRRYFCSNEHVLLTQDALECLPDFMLNAARTKAATLSGLPADAITGEWLFRVCDEAVVQRGSMGDREIFVYREGFYRGLWAAMLLLFIAIIVRMSVSGATVHMASGDRTVGVGVFWFFLVAVGVCIHFSFQRFRRFGRYRITQALLAFLVMPEEKKKDKEKKDDEK